LYSSEETALALIYCLYVFDQGKSYPEEELQVVAYLCRFVASDWRTIQILYYAWTNCEMTSSDAVEGNQLDLKVDPR